MLNEDDKDNTINFEELGVDRVFVDEAHMFKNLYYNSKLTGVAGLSQSESNRAIDMFMKFRYLDETTGGKGCIMATSTPLSNSLSEMYTMQRFLQFDTLEEHGLYGFDDWVSAFGDIVTSYEVAPEGNGKYRERRRFAEFFNLPELMNIFTQVADIKTSDMVDIEKPITNRHTIVAQPCEITKKYIEELSKRADAIRRGSVKPEEDNMLAVTNDGRKIGLDIRLMNNYLPDNPTSKVNMCVQKIFDIWDNTKEDKLTQLLFSDLSTPKAGKDAGFNIYDDVREKLVAKGIPREEVQFIHEAKNDAQKKALFEKVRNGEVRILLGSTEKLGSGTNVQTKLKALHNLDVT